MAIDFNKANLASKAPQAGARNAEERPKAQFWLNIGYNVDVPVTSADGAPAGTETRFVSLPVGIPLDSQDALATNSRNEGFAAFQSARNDLLTQVMAAAEKLAPGEEKILNLSIQLRRVNDDAAPIPAASNPFVKALEL